MDETLTQYNLLIVSDLHMSEGIDPEKKTMSRNEDFFFDEEFASFLRYYSDNARWPGKKWNLIINGDFLDFLQVVSTDDIDPEELDYLRVRSAADARSLLGSDPRDPGYKKHKKYGFPCGAAETVFKLLKIMNGHWLFFEALAEFVAAGNVVTIGKGNHDVEFHYGEVRSAIRRKLRAIYGEKLKRENQADRDRKVARIQDESILFLGWFYYEKGLLWVEHGNQYDKFNNFKFWLSPLMPNIPDWTKHAKRKDDIDLPWGSLFVRYLFNHVEGVVPYADNIKPQSKFISWLFANQPLKALHFLLRDGSYMLSRMARAWKPVSTDMYEQREEEHKNRLRDAALEWGIEEADLVFVDNLRAWSALKEPRGVWRWIGGFIRHFWWLVVPLISVVLLAVALSMLAPVFEWILP